MFTCDKIVVFISMKETLVKLDLGHGPKGHGHSKQQNIISKGTKIFHL